MQIRIFMNTTIYRNKIEINIRLKYVATRLRFALNISYPCASSLIINS